MSINRQFVDRMLELSYGPTPIKEGVTDMHLHVVDFLQQSEGLSRLLQQMKAANVNRTVIFGLPVKKKWVDHEWLEPHYYLDDNAKCYYWSAVDEFVASSYLALEQAERDRLAPTIVGFNPTDLCARDYLEAIYDKYPIWKGVGEVLLRHDDLTNLTIGETARANHKALIGVLEFCRTHDLPINIHQNVTSVLRHSVYEYRRELEEFMQSAEGVSVLWAHCGSSRRVTHPDYPDMVNEVLGDYENLSVDLSWVVFDNEVCNEHGHVKKEWVELIVEYPDRFMIGSDLCGHFDALPQTIGRYHKLFERLPADVAAKVARENADALWFS